VTQGKDEARVATELREAEEALRRQQHFADSLLETAPAIVLVLDPEGRIVRFNRYMEQVSGYSLDEVRGQDWFSTFLAPKDDAEIRQVFDDTLETHFTHGIVNAIVSRDGEERVIEWNNKTLTDDDGQVTGILAIGQDITDRMQLEEQLRRSQKMEAIARLAGGIAHDFNTLLGSILGYAEMQLDTLKQGDPLRRPAEQIRRAAERGVTLTRQLMGFSRRRDSHPEVVDLRASIYDMEDMLRRLTGDDTELVFNLASDLWRVEIDRGHVEQVLMNLVVNGADAMPRGGRMTLTARNLDHEAIHRRSGLEVEAGDYVMLSVRDNGSGMDEATRSRIFEPFFTTKEPGKGTGLGLYTVYGIVDQNRGQIAVKSQLGKGTTFEIYLPRVHKEASVEDEMTEPVHQEGGSEVVLLVEDDEMFRELIYEVLTGAGYTVLTAEEPAQALELVEEHNGTIDLLISDMVMPGMTGGELARQLTTEKADLKVLLMSGYTPEDLAKRGGVQDVAFIEKPFNTKVFKSKVRQILDAA